MSVLLAAAISMSGCTTAPSKPATARVETPTLYEYAAPVQARAREESAHLGLPCPRTEVDGACSALKRLLLDYLQVRDEIRALLGDLEAGDAAR